MYRSAAQWAVEAAASATRRHKMRLRILGTRGNIEVSVPRHLQHSGILIDTGLLLDIGEREYLNYRPQWIFVTHLHSDHMALQPGDIPKGVLYVPEIYIRMKRVLRPVVVRHKELMSDFRSPKFCREFDGRLGRLGRLSMSSTERGKGCVGGLRSI